MRSPTSACSPGAECPSTGLNPTLYQYSYIYRLWFSWQVASRSVHDDTAGAALIKKSLAELRTLLQPSGARLTVLVLPPCRKDKWPDTERKRHDMSLTLLRELGVEHYDLEKGLAKAVEKGVELQESKGDTLHPSQAAATSFVEQLVAEKFELK